MFTGIIEAAGRVIDVHETPGGVRLTVDTSGLEQALAAGESLAVNGVCLTAVQPTRRQSQFDVIQETLRRSNFSRLKVGDTVNLERSVGPQSRFDGHFVQGHVDAIGSIERVHATTQEYVLWIGGMDDIAPLVVPKGSIAINGVSLTIAQIGEQAFSVALIPTTLQHTNLAALQVGDLVNIETDILARTVAHQLKAYLSDHPAEAARSGLSRSTLMEHGFS